MQWLNFSIYCSSPCMINYCIKYQNDSIFQIFLNSYGKFCKLHKLIPGHPSREISRLQPFSNFMNYNLFIYFINAVVTPKRLSQRVASVHEILGTSDNTSPTHSSHILNARNALANARDETFFVYG